MSVSIARQAAALWGIAPDALALAARRENIVYRAETAEGPRALRLHRPGYRTETELRSEMQWMETLAQNGLSVPLPHPSVNGRLIEVIDNTPISVLTWMPGAQAGKLGDLNIPDRLSFAHTLGRTMARLHDLSDAWQTPSDFSRPHWDLNGLLGQSPLWGPFWDNPDLTPAQADTLRQVRHLAHSELASRQGDLDYGLIHADILTENVLVQGPLLSLIDFDDGGWGFRDFEIATFLMRFQEAPDYEDLRDALLEGYAIRRAICLESLAFFIMIRALTYPGWIIPRRHEPGGVARSKVAIETALPLAEKYLAACQ